MRRGTSFWRISVIFRFGREFRSYSAADRPAAAGAVSGLLAALALPPFDVWPLAFVALVPLVVSAASPRVSREGAVQAGLAFGAGFYGLLLHWVPFTLQGMIPLGAVSGVLLLAILVGFGGLQGLAIHALVRLRGLTPLLVVPVVWVGTEFILSHAGALALPWLPLALALTSVPEVAGISELSGPSGVTLWISAVNGALAVALSGPRTRHAVWAGLVAMLAIGPALWGLWRARTLQVEELPPILLVQMNVPRPVLLDPSARDVAAGEALDRLLDGEPGPPGTDEERPVLVILPEAPFAEPWNSTIQANVQAHADRLEIPILVGTHLSEDGLGRSGSGSGGEAETSSLRNAVVLVEPGGSTAEPVHGKVRLVPGVERPGLAPGTRGDAREVGGIRIGILICFEAAFPSEARHLRASGARLLVNPSNDGWYRPAWFGMGRSAAHAQHRAHLVLRAIETRAGAVRSSLGGDLLAVDPSGRVAHSRSPGMEGTVVVTTRSARDETAFTRMGDLVGLAGLLLLGGTLLIPPRGDRRTI